MAGSIQLITAGTLTPLLAQLVDEVRRVPLSPLETETIVVQSQGMRRWVTLQLADALGCAGSLALPFPAGFIHDLSRRLLPLRASRDVEEAFSREAMTWRIEALLRTLPRDEVHAPLVAYVDDADDRARFGLAGRIADRFDDYQLYRADLLAAWEAGRDTPDTPHARWQASLWRTLCAEVGGAPQHAGARLQQLIALLQSSTPPRNLPSRVTVFGVSSLPPLFVDVLAALATHIPVRVLSAMVTADDPHPLATAFGAQGQEFFGALRARGATHTVLPDASTAAHTLLGTLQRELSLGGQDLPSLVPSRTDSSLRVHSAHGEMRQLEIIRDQLLDALQADPSLRPHDLLLLVPDAGEWAPLVDAVFGASDTGVSRLPYRIADRPARGEQPAAAAFALLLGLQGGRLTHSEVFELLSYPLVHEAIGLTEAQVDALASRTHEANARWGYDAAAREALGLPAYEDASWRATLDRLLVGVMTGPHDDLVLEVLPHSGDTAGDTAGVARLAQWVDNVAALIGGWTDARSLQAWADAMDEAVTLLFGPPDLRDVEQVSTLVRLLGRLRSQTVAAQFAGEVTFGVVRDWIEGELDGDGFGSGFLTGGMTVAALKPMRSLPFRVIAVVGLDEGVFPRRNRRTAFDMLEHDRRVGDRDLRSDDRQLFLDLLMAAGDRLLLAYSGRAVSDNAPCAASVVIDELLDHVDRRSGGAGRDALLVEHPLQPFSPRYFTGTTDPRLFTFSSAHARTAAAVEQGRRSDLPFITGPLSVAASGPATTFELTIDDLADAWGNASRAFCRHALGFTLWSAGEQGGDDELLVPDTMQIGGVRARMLAAALRGETDTARELRRLQGSGAVPPRALGAQWYASLQTAVNAALEKVPMDVPSDVIPISIAADDWRVSGALTGVRGSTRYVVRASSFRPLHEVRAWVEHVVLCAACESGETSVQTTVLVGTETKDGVIKGKVCDTYTAVPNARAVLAQLLAAARRGRAAPLVFFPAAAMAWRKAKRSNEKFLAGTDKRIKSLKDPQALAYEAYAYEPEYEGMPGDHADAHVALCFRGVDPLQERWDEFEQLAQEFFGMSVAGGGA